MGTRRTLFKGKFDPLPAYWIVAGAVLTKNPFRHKEINDAAKEAIRLARLHPEQIFTVYGAQMKFRFLSDLTTEQVAAIDINSEKDPAANSFEPEKLPADKVIKDLEKKVGELKVAFLKGRAELHRQQETINRLKAEAAETAKKSVSIETVGLVGTLMAGSQSESSKILAENAKYLIEASFEHGFYQGTHVGRLDHQAEFRAWMGIAGSKEEQVSLVWPGDPMLECLDAFKRNSALYKSMFPKDPACTPLSTTSPSA